VSPKRLLSSADLKKVHNAAATRPLTIEEIRLVADLRVMHAKIDELYQVVTNLKRRHGEESVRIYSDRKVLEENIHRVDEIYLWFVSLKERR
jgi:hypothetical protein